MSNTESSQQFNTGDALIDEVRRIRREICLQVDNDVDRLCDHLSEVADSYNRRRGPFAIVSKAAADRVVQSWGEQPLQTDDPLIDEVRESRKRLTGESRP